MHDLLVGHPFDDLLSIDWSHIEVHQDASNAVGGAAAQASGKTKGGANTKLAAVIDGLGRAVGLSIVAVNRYDLRAIATLVTALASCWIIADCGSDSKSFRQDLAAVGAATSIPPRKSSRIQYHFSETPYKHRHVVENFFARVKRIRLASLRGLKRPPNNNARF